MNDLKSIIKIPIMVLGGYPYYTKEASIDFKNKTITTLRTKKGEEEGELYTQPYYDVDRYEWFSVGRYLLPLFLILTSDISLTVKNGFGLFFGALFVFVYHYYMRGYISTDLDLTEKEGFFSGLWQKCKNIWITAKYYIITLLYFIALNLLFYSVGSGSYYIKGIVEYTLYGIMIYESTRSFVGKEWSQYKKVKVNSWIPQYFMVIDEASKHEQKLTDELSPKINIAVASLMAIASIFLAYKGVYAFKEYKAEQAAMAQYVQQSQYDAMKLQSEQNGSAQIVITYEKIRFDPKTEALNEKLGIKAGYKEIKKTTYPWEKGYVHGGTTIHKPSDLDLVGGGH